MKQFISPTKIFLVFPRRCQKNEVSLVVHNLPVIYKVAALAKVFGNMFGLSQVRTVAVLGLVFHNGELDKIDKSCYNLFIF